MTLFAKYMNLKRLMEEAESPMIEHKGEMVHKTNSEGHLIHHTDEGIKKFHSWSEGHEVKDEQGKPSVFYHGTSSNFKEFQSGTGNQWGKGHYFIKSQKIASEYSTGETTGAHARVKPEGNAAANVMPVYLKMKKPFVMDAPLTGQTVKHVEKHLGEKLKDHTWPGMKNRDLHQVLHQNFLPNIDAANDVLKKAGFDGMRDKAHDSIHMVFDSKNVKSSLGNNGKFSKKSSDISEETNEI